MDIRQSLEILGLESVASPEELKRAYRDLVKIWHPDRFHSNPGLGKIAGEKLKEINFAYKHLHAYFDPSQSKRLRTSTPASQGEPSGPGEINKAGFQQGKQSGNFSDPLGDTHRGQSGQFSGFKPSPAPKTSSIGKYALFLFFCVLLGASGLIIYYFSKIDNIASKSTGRTFEALEKMVIEAQKNEIVKRDNPNIIRDQSKELKPAETRKYFIIYLESGSSIITESYWEEDNMIMYRKYGGSMGIEKAKVKKVVARVHEIINR